MLNLVLCPQNYPFISILGNAEANFPDLIISFFIYLKNMIKIL